MENKANLGKTFLDEADKARRQKSREETERRLAEFEIELEKHFEEFIQRRDENLRAIRCPRIRAAAAKFDIDPCSDF